MTDDIEQRLRYHARAIARSLLRPDVQGIQRLIMSVRARFPELTAAMHEKGSVLSVVILQPPPGVARGPCGTR